MLGKPLILSFSPTRLDGAQSIGVQNVTSNCNVATLISFFFSLYLAICLASGETFIRWYNI